MFKYLAAFLALASANRPPATENTDETVALQKNLQKKISHGGEQAWGKFTVKRQWTNGKDTLEKNSVFCGWGGDTFHIATVPGAYCKEKHGTDVQGIVDQTGVMVSEGWFCANQGTVTIVGTPTFQKDPDCDPEHGLWGKWTVTRHCAQWNKDKVDTFCGMRTDTFQVTALDSKFCQSCEGRGKNCKETQNGWAVVNEVTDEMEAWPWYCDNQCKPTITSATFQSDPICVAEDRTIGANLEEVDKDAGPTVDCGDENLPPKDGACLDIPNPYMKNRNHTCSMGWIGKKRCDMTVNTHADYWKKCQFCAQSCWDYHQEKGTEFPYGNLKCGDKA